MAGAALLLGTSCGEDDPPVPEPPVVVPEPQPEPEPTPGESVGACYLRVVPDWSDALSEETVPDTYTLLIGERKITAEAHNIYMYSDSLAVGSYALTAYNEPKGITLTENMAEIDRTEEGSLIALPGYLFAADTTVAVAKGDTATVSLTMRRLTAPIALRLDFTEAAEVKEAEATLSGLIAAIHLPDGEPMESTAGKETLTQMAYEEQDGHRGITLRSRGFGIRKGASQILSARITLADGRVLQFRVDLSEYLSDLDPLEPIQLKTEIDTTKPDEPDPEDPQPDPTPDPEPEPEPQPEPGTPADISSSIKDWTIVKGGDIEAK